MTPSDPRCPTCNARPELERMLGERVRVTNPRIGKTWVGRIVSIAKVPTLRLQTDDGRQVDLSQELEIAPIEHSDGPGRTP